MDPLSSRSFRNLFAATTASAAGVAVAGLAIPLVAVDVLRASSFEAGLVSAMLTAPFLLIGLPAGAWVDRLDRRRVLVTCQLLRGALLALVPVVWSLDLLSIPFLVGVVFLFGVCNVLHDVAYFTFLPEIVPDDRLVPANGRIESVRQAIGVAGPAAAGQVVAVLTAPVSLAVTSVLLATSSSFLARTRRTSTAAPARDGVDEPLRAAVVAGMQLVLGDPRLRALAGSSAIVNFCAAAAFPVTTVLLVQDLELSAATIGVIYSITGLGGFVGASTSRRLLERVGHGRALWLVPLLGSPFLLLMPFATRSWVLWAAAAGTAVAAAATVTFNVGNVSACQLLAPRALLGRVNATVRFLTWSAMPLGSLLGGAVASALGTRTGLLLVSGLGCLAFLPVLRSPLRGTRELSTVTPEPS